MFKVVPEVPKPLLIFLNSCFFILSWLNIYFFFCAFESQFPLPSLLVPCTFSFVSLSIAFIFSSSFQPNSTNSVSVLITSVLICASDRLSISSFLVLFLEFWSVLSFGSYFFVSTHLLHCKGWSLNYSPEWGNTHSWVVAPYMGEGTKREQFCLLSSQPGFSHFPCYAQANCALLVLIPWWGDLCMF